MDLKLSAFLKSLITLSLIIVTLIGCKLKEKGEAYVNVNAKPAVISHTFFLAGPQFTGIIHESDSIIWNADRPGARDGYVLPNGHILICWQDEVVEFSRDKQVLFRYQKSDKNTELGTVQRLENGNTLISELGEEPRLLEVDNEGKIQVEVPLQPETDNYHMQTRMARKLENGNYLVPHLLAFSVKEYSPDGQIVNVIQTDLEELGGREGENWPFTAIRLKNGNTIINLTHGNKTIEVDHSGKVIWKMGNEDTQENPFQDPCGAQRLPNGNTVIASYGAKEGIKMFEVNAQKEIVWKYTGRYRIHHFQILSTNGKPLSGKPLK